MFEQKRPKFRIFHDNTAYFRTRVIAPNVATARGWSEMVLLDEKWTNWKEYLGDQYVALIEDNRATLPPGALTLYRRTVGKVGKVGKVGLFSPPWELTRDPTSLPERIPAWRRGWWWMFYVSPALAFLAKGPVGWMPLLALPRYKWWTRKSAEPGHVGREFGEGYQLVENGVRQRTHLDDTTMAASRSRYNPTLQPIESAVAAPLCRRSPRRRGRLPAFGCKPRVVVRSRCAQVKEGEAASQSTIDGRRRGFIDLRRTILKIRYGKRQAGEYFIVST